MATSCACSYVFAAWIQNHTFCVYPVDLFRRCLILENIRTQALSNVNMFCTSINCKGMKGWWLLEVVCTNIREQSAFIYKKTPQLCKNFLSHFFKAKGTNMYSFTPLFISSF